MAGKKVKSSGRRVVVMGLGNLLLSDEGVGVHFYRLLEERGGLPAGVELMDAGTSALDALQLLGPVDLLVAVDAVKGGGQPGDIYRFTPADIRDARKMSASLHQLGFLEALEMAGHAGRAPRRVVIIGIEPKTLSLGLELSPEIEAKLPKLVSLVRGLLREELGTKTRDAKRATRKG